MEEKKILLTIAYKGTAYCGFQRQPNGESIESLLNSALTGVAGHPVSILGASRTDTGVHALGQCATFVLYGSIPVDRIPNAVNGLLPGDIVVLQAKEVPKSFHCRYDAVGKHYRYVIRNTDLPSPFDRDTAYFFPGELDTALMGEASSLFIGEKNFRAFTASNSGRNNFVRKLDKIEISRDGEYIFLDFWGEGFLYKMVRSISGALIDVGRGYFGMNVIEKALLSGDRSLLSLTAPAYGLTLIKIYYDDEYYLDKGDPLR